MDNSIKQQYKMKSKKLIFVVINALVMCGNVFAVSPYANTIQQNINKKSFLTVASFPTTSADVGFINRMESKRAGYMPYFNRSAFSDLSIAEQDELESMAYRSELERQHFFATHTLMESCENYPDSSECPGASTYTNNPYDKQTADTSQESIYPTMPPSVFQPGQNLYVPYMLASITPENISKYNLKTYDGGCTPPERSKHWRNDIQTSGHYQFSNPAFEKFMITAFRKEGGCVNNPNDHGGYTCYGCASVGLCNGIDMNNITRAKVEDLAFSKIYKQYNVDKLPDAFRGYLLWGMWGSGSITGIKQFQGALGVKPTGKIDAATIYAAEHYVGDFANTYTIAREQFYRNIVERDSSQKVFLKGWLNGLDLLRSSGCHVIPINPIYR